MKTTTKEVAVKKTAAIDLEKSNKEKVFVIYDINALENISKKCIKTAKHCEFQVHYEALHIEIQKDEKRVSIMIPTCYYNFKQEVNAAYVDCHLDDVSKAYENIKGKKDLSELKGLLNSINSLKELGMSVEFKLGDFGSIHRHPDRIPFSRQDLKNDPEDTGIIYRKANFKGLQTDSILYIPNNDASKTEVFLSEARRIDISESETGISGTYQEVECYDVIYSQFGFYDEEEPDFNDILNFKEVKKSEVKILYHYYKDGESKNLLLESVMKAYHESGFTPNIDFVDEKLIEIEKPSNLYKINNQSINDFKMDGDLEEVELITVHANAKLKEEIIEAENIGTYYKPVYRYKGMIFDELNGYSVCKDGNEYFIQSLNEYYGY